MPSKRSSSGKSIKERRAPAVEALTFEEAFRELEAVVAQLEGDGLALDESLALFERGQQLAGHCGAQLDAAELRVQQLHRGALTPLQLADESRGE